MQILRSDSPLAIRLLLSAFALCFLIALALRLVSFAAGIAGNTFTYAMIALATVITSTVGIAAWRFIGHFSPDTVYRMALGLAAVPAATLLMWPGTTTTATNVFNCAVLAGVVTALMTTKSAPRVSAYAVIALAVLAIASVTLVVYLSAGAAANAAETTRRVQSFAIFPTSVVLGAVAAAILVRRKSGLSAAA